ncbi:MAG TPA: hypothetical protein VEI82_15010 [Myxococcota bacterium]|nr:hypothetical protein [Myxococcota bacterium]
MVLVDVAPGVQRSSGAQRIREFTSGAPDPLDSIEEAVARAREFNPRRDPALLRRSLLHNLRERPDGRLTWKYDRRFLAIPLAERGAELEGLGAAASQVASGAGGARR